MRDRHWKMLMQATNKSFVMDSRFCLGDLLALELHNFVDVCSEIVDRQVGSGRGGGGTGCRQACALVSPRPPSLPVLSMRDPCRLPQPHAFLLLSCHRAQKELNIEKQLKRIEDTWRGLALAFSPYQDTDINSLHVRGQRLVKVTGSASDA